MTMFVSNGTIDRVMLWHESHGGGNIHPRGQALKALGEMVELCIAAGADSTRIAKTVAEEISKSEQRGELLQGVMINPKREEMIEEVADVLVNLIVICRENNIDPERAVLTKMLEIEARKWQADEDGVLRRPERTET